MAENQQRDYTIEMDTIKFKTSLGTPIQDLFVGRVIKRTMADEKPRRSGLTLEFEDLSFLRVWFEVIHLDDWDVTGALRISEDSTGNEPRGIAHDIFPPHGIYISSVSLLRVNFDAKKPTLQVDNGIVLHGSKGESLTIVSSPMAGAMDFGIDATIESLETEYSPESYMSTTVKK